MDERDLPSDEQLEGYFQRQKEAYAELEKDPRSERMTFSLPEWMYQWIRRRAYEWDVTKSQAVHDLLQSAIFEWHEHTGTPLVIDRGRLIDAASDADDAS